jgi:hypothetical protein
MNRLSEALRLQDPRDGEQSLEILMQKLANEKERLEIGRAFRLDTPILLLIASGSCRRICRKNLFCPFPSCRDEIKSNAGLLTHLNKKHDLSRTCCKDLMRKFLHGLAPREVHIKLRAGDGQVVDKPWDVERCPYPSCNYFTEKHQSLVLHIKNHKDLYKNMQSLG